VARAVASPATINTMSEAITSNGPWGSGSYGSLPMFSEGIAEEGEKLGSEPPGEPESLKIEG